MRKLLLLFVFTFLTVTIDYAQDSTVILHRSKDADGVLFGKGKLSTSKNFVGKVYYEVLEPKGSQISNVTFEPGARTNWHMHPDGQVLLITEGVGYYQEKGKPIHIVHKGDIVKIAPNVWHWHGASKTKSMSHIALSIHQETHPSQWGEPVTEKEYNSTIAND